jgi:hypothetical protein
MAQELVECVKLLVIKLYCSFGNFFSCFDHLDCIGYFYCNFLDVVQIDPDYFGVHIGSGGFDCRVFNHYCNCPVCPCCSVVDVLVHQNSGCDCMFYCGIDCFRGFDYNGDFDFDSFDIVDFDSCFDLHIDSDMLDFRIDFDFRRFADFDRWPVVVA